MQNQVITFGCRLNAYESEVIKNNLAKAGRKNVVVFNTCTVTKEAERQARQAIRRLHKENPEAEIIVTGCGAQVTPEKYARMKEVARVIGNHEKLQAETFVDFGSERVVVNDIMSVKETASAMLAGFEDHARAFVQVQNGCNHRCTFCIIPYGRGNSRSVPVGEVVNQVQMLVNSGYNEVVLTGVDISDYGLDLPGKPTLGNMIRRVLAMVPTLKRLRISSIDVAEIDMELIQLIENEVRLMPHLHLSLQSGDDMILKRMKRRHTRGQIIEFVEKARILRPDVVFGADIIAGFPTETDAMFDNTLKIIEEAGLTYLHVFPYSEREGTPATKMPQVEKKVRKERAKLLRQIGDLQLEKFLKTRVGKRENVVVEKNNLARTEHFAAVKLIDKLPVGSLAQVTIGSAEKTQLIAA